MDRYRLQRDRRNRVTERARFVAAVDEGIADADAGRLRDHDEVVAHMRARIGARVQLVDSREISRKGAKKRKQAFRG